MMSPSIIFVGSGALLAIAAALLFTGNGASERQLRERVVATRDLRPAQGLLAESLIYTPAKQGSLLKLASWLGYRSDLPPAYAASPKIVVPMAAIIGTLVFEMAGRLIPNSAAVGVGLIVAVAIARFLFRRKSKAYTNLLFKQIPDTMSLMLRAVRAGLPLAEAIRNVGRESMAPTRDEFARVAGETALGSPLEIAVRRLADRTAIQEYAFFSVIIGLHAQTGGNLSETLENLSEMVRRRVAMVAKGRAMSAEGRLSAAVVAGLPFVVGLLTLVLNPGYLDEFLTNPRGPTLILVFVILFSIGMLVTHLLIQRSTED